MVKEVVKLSYCEFEALVPRTEQGGAFSNHSFEIMSGFSKREVERGLEENHVCVCLQFSRAQFAGERSDFPCVILGL
ncbi:unnamed protein product [Mesocestoides corti]|uniref:Uncharacterized protein n=1 Tax=Mesocestoides corti TaxID=53468 RepID=A0A0R3ULQ6_MESCO|nr:unnamed protein product [Mesocestoides corti]